MTDTPDTDADCVDAVLTILDRLESEDLRPEETDVALTLLSNRRRRLLIDVVRTYEGGLTLPDAAEEVAKRETGVPVTALSPEHIRDVYVSLYHDHLPRLVRFGLLEYEQERDLVEPGYRG